MQARAPLMIEHRFIERMIALINLAIPRIRSENTVEPEFIDTIVDYFFTYIDKTHHGKEEKILFKSLEEKAMSDPDRLLMHELIEEHTLGKNIAAEIAEANSRHREGVSTALPDIVAGLVTLTDFYPKHIEKEDTVFFPNSRAYLSEQEDKVMLEAFREFDRKMIHDVYRERVEELERKLALSGQAVESHG